MASPFDQPPPDTDSSVATITEPRLRRKRGRPLEMSQPEVLARIRHLASTESGLFRVHRTHSDLYARARRQFGSWALAVAAAGMDYANAVNTARQRATVTRRERLRARSLRT